MDRALPEIEYHEMSPYEHNQRQREKDAAEGKPVGYQQRFSHWIHTFMYNEADLAKMQEQRKAEYQAKHGIR